MLDPRRSIPALPLLLVALSLAIAQIACGSSTPVVEPPAGELPAGPEATQPPAAPPTEAPVGTSRSNPAPFAYQVTVDDITLSVTEVTRPADDIVRQGNQFNAAPEDGQEYVFIMIAMVCNLTSDQTCSASEFDFKLVGSSGVVRDPQIMLAGVSDLFEGGDFFGDATKTGYLAFIVDQGETDLVLMYQPFLGGEAFLAAEQPPQ